MDETGHSAPTMEKLSNDAAAAAEVARITVIDGDEDRRRTLGQILGAAGYAVQAVGANPQPGPLLSTGSPDLLLVAGDLPERTRGSVYALFGEQSSPRAIPVILVGAPAGDPALVCSPKGLPTTSPCPSAPPKS
jgi:CheY-like chemotaxis protein